MEVVPSSSCENSEGPGPESYSSGPGPVPPRVSAHGERPQSTDSPSDEQSDAGKIQLQEDKTLDQKQEETPSADTAASHRDSDDAQKNEDHKINCVPEEATRSAGDDSKEVGNSEGPDFTVTMGDCDLTPGASGEEEPPSCPLIVGSDSPLRVNPDAQGEVAPLAS